LAGDRSIVQQKRGCAPGAPDRSVAARDRARLDPV